MVHLVLPQIHFPSICLPHDCFCAREELEQYLTESRDRRSSTDNADDDGPLVHFPPNLDSIAQAMTREDLLDPDRRGWSYHLVGDRFDRDLAEYDQGRYKYRNSSTWAHTVYSLTQPPMTGLCVVGRGLFTAGYGPLGGGGREDAEQLRLDRGLAEIALLDRQLLALERRARASAHSETPVPEAASEEDDTFLTRPRGVGSAVGGLPHAPSATDDRRLAQLLSEDDAGDPGLAPSSSYRRLLSAAQATRLDQLDDQLARYRDPQAQSPVEQGVSDAGDEAAGLQARLARVRAEFSRALDQALDRVRGGAGQQVATLP